jgi:CRP-like cAMP-binding protein
MDASDLELLLGSAEERSLRLPRGSAPSDPALSSSVAVTPVRVVVVPWARIGEVRYAHPAWNRFSVRVLEHFYLLKARREYEPLALDAAGRYDVFRQAFPGLEDRVKQADIASYLGISPEHLSRLRRARRDSDDLD